MKLEYEDFLAYIYTPLKSIMFLSDIIYTKSQFDWNMCENVSKEDIEQLWCCTLAIKSCARNVLRHRENALYEMDKEYKSEK